jgi:hypothetical protein
VASNSSAFEIIGGSILATTIVDDTAVYGSGGEAQKDYKADDSLDEDDEDNDVDATPSIE